MDKPPATNDTIALLDIGSNALRCILARLDDRPGFEIAFRRRVQTRLGASPTDELPARAVKATLRAARRFLKRVRREPGSARVLAVATAAVRDAKNRDALLGALSELGVGEVRVLSGAEEGRLGAEAALRALPIERGVVVDLGGGSLQVTRVEGGVIQPSHSVPLGVARLLRRFVESDPATPSEIEALRVEVHTRAGPLLSSAPARGRLLVSGGVVNALARLASLRRQPVNGGEAMAPTHGCSFGQAELSALRAWLEPMTMHRRRQTRGLKPDRADVIVVGAVVLEAVLALSGYAELTVSRTSVREAVLWDEAVRRAQQMS